MFDKHYLENASQLKQYYSAIHTFLGVEVPWTDRERPADSDWGARGK